MSEVVVAITLTEKEQEVLAREFRRGGSGYGKSAQGPRSILRKVYDALPTETEQP